MGVTIIWLVEHIGVASLDGFFTLSQSQCFISAPQEWRCGGFISLFILLVFSCLLGHVSHNIRTSHLDKNCCRSSSALCFPDSLKWLIDSNIFYSKNKAAHLRSIVRAIAFCVFIYLSSCPPLSHVRAPVLYSEYVFRHLSWCSWLSRGWRACIIQKSSLTVQYQIKLMSLFESNCDFSVNKDRFLHQHRQNIKMSKIFVHTQ